MAAGLERSVYPTAGIVPSPIQPGVLEDDGGGLLGVGLPLTRVALSLLPFPSADSFLLSWRAPSRSTRSRHWTSSARMESCRALSVSDFGV